MDNNAIINGRLDCLLNILDARANVDIFISETELLKSGKVYEFLADPDFIKTYARRYYVIGLTVGLSTSIMIAKEVN